MKTVLNSSFCAVTAELKSRLTARQKSVFPRCPRIAGKPPNLHCVDDIHSGGLARQSEVKIPTRHLPKWKRKFRNYLDLARDIGVLEFRNPNPYSSYIGTFEREIHVGPILVIWYNIRPILV